MTPEQEKVIGKCQAMIKLAFQPMTGKIIFRLKHFAFGKQEIECDMFMPNVRTRQEAERTVNEVDLGKSSNGKDEKV